MHSPVSVTAVVSAKNVGPSLKSHLTQTQTTSQRNCGGVWRLRVGGLRGISRRDLRVRLVQNYPGLIDHTLQDRDTVDRCCLSENPVTLCNERAVPCLLLHACASAPLSIKAQLDRGSWASPTEGAQLFKVQGQEICGRVGARRYGGSAPFGFNSSDTCCPAFPLSVA